MAIDSPARIAVIGAGPIGLEVALYARFLGYEVDIYERGRIGENLLAWGHVPMFSPFRLNRSELGLAALQAQDPAWQSPADEAILTGRQLVEQYFLPLSQTDLLSDCLRLRTEILSIGRDGHLKGDSVGDLSRGDSSFRILARSTDGGQSARKADIVIDASGTYGNHNWLGQGGIPAVGELEFACDIEYGLPDILGSHRERYLGQHTLVVGAGYSAATSVSALGQLAGEQPSTQVTWVTRAERELPLHRIANDRLPVRDQLALAANELATADTSYVAHWPGTMVHRLEIRVPGSSAKDQAAGFDVELVGRHAGRLSIDRIIANVGYRPDDGLYRELQVHVCYASEGPMGLAAALLNQASPDCLDHSVSSSDTLQCPEPNFYIMGSKSYGRGSQFLISTGLGQIRQLFTIVGDSPTLDLYSSIRNLNSSSDCTRLDTRSLH